MSFDKPRLRGNKPALYEPWSIGFLPQEAIIGIGKQIVHRIAVGHEDITGDDFGTIFADSIGGGHRESPLGIADVVLNGMAWSVKTIKVNNPFTQKAGRFISGRNSPDYSHDISDPHKNIQATGKAVLSIWNERINEALNVHDEIRGVFLLRNLQTKKFLIFEQQISKFVIGDYAWTKNEHNNFEGRYKNTKEHVFTWQPHGGQFTIIRSVPPSAIKFIINRHLPIIEPEKILGLVHFDDSWIEILG